MRLNRPRSRPVSMVMRIRLAIAIVAFLTACSEEVPSMSPESSTAPSTESSMAPPGDVAELTATGEPLAPGTYTRAEFEPRITLELDGSWEAVQLFPGFFDVQQRVGAPDVIAIQFAQVRGVYGPAGTTEPADAGEAAELLGANPDLEVVETSASRIGGLDGSQITVENAGDAHASVIQVTPGPLGIDPGRRLWLAFFDTDAGLLAVMVGGSTAGWDEALALAEPVLESVRIGP